MEDEKRTPAQWTEYFAMEQTPITKEDYLIGVTARLYGLLHEMMLAMQHVEGMQSSHDDFMARYAQVIGIEYIPSPVVQQALREHKLKELQAAREDNIRELPVGVSPNGEH